MIKPLKRVLVLASLAMLHVSFASNVGGDPGDPLVRFTLGELNGAKRLVERRVIRGERHLVKAPAAALELFPRLKAHFHRAERQLRENQQLRYSPTSIESVISSHELDIDLRERFNTVLKGAKQDIGAQEDYFGQLEAILEREEASRERVAEAFERARAILEEEIAPVARDDRVGYLDLSWPKELPSEVYSQLEATLSELLDNQGEERAAVWSRLQRSLRRFEQANQEAQRSLQNEIDMHRRLLAFDPEDLFLDLVNLIDLCMKENESYIKRSERAILVTRGEEATDTVPNSPQNEESDSEETMDLTTDTQGKGGGSFKSS